MPVSESQLGCCFSDTVHLQSTSGCLYPITAIMSRGLMVLSSLRRSLTVLGNNRIRQPWNDPVSQCLAAVAWHCGTWRHCNIV